jgi:2-polyprenyl-6-methoxyphenol hydroxylase-like FAD-dependent oxidoreductase
MKKKVSSQVGDGSPAGPWDLVVAGGGIAGAAAAVAAARAGTRVCLLEKEYAFGGLATIGNIVVYLPLCDGLGRQVSFGLAEELLRLSVKDPAGAEQIPHGWLRKGKPVDGRQERFRATFNAASFILELDDWVVGAGVAIQFDTRCVDVVRRGDRITGVVTESKAGRIILPCRAVIDATGDADVCAAAGEPTVALDGNAAALWYWTAGKNGLRRRVCAEPFDLLGRQNPPGSHNFSGIDPADITAQVLESRRQMRRHLQHMRREEEDPAMVPLQLPSIPSLRMTRRLDAPGIEEADDRRWCDDAIGMIGHWRRRGPVYFVPYRSLVGIKTANLFAVGRCCGAGATGWDLMRVIPTCAVTGEAAGLAAAMCVREGEDARRLEVVRLQAALRENGGRIDRALADEPLHPDVDADTPASH